MVAGKGGQLRRGSMLHCKAIAPKYGVTPKTIRDVWSGRSWAEATKPLWTEEEIKRRSANEEDSKHSIERSGMPPHAMHPDDPSRMAVSYPYMPGMVRAARVRAENVLQFKRALCSGPCAVPSALGDPASGVRV